MFPDENLQPADFLRQEGDIGYFQTPDGSRVSVDLRQSPYARQIAARALVERSAQGQALDAPALPPPPPTPAPGPMSLAEDEPMSQPAAPDWSPVEIDSSGADDSPAARRERVRRNFLGSIYQRDAEAISQGLPTMQERHVDVGRRLLRLPPMSRTSSEIVSFNPSDEPPAVVQPSQYAQDMPWRAPATQLAAATPPAAPPTQTPDEIRRQYALTQMMPAFQGPQPPAPPALAGPQVPSTDAEREAIRRQYALTQMMPAFAGPQPPAPVAAAPLGAPAAQPQPSAQPMRIRAPQPSLDALMVPQGYSPTLIEEIAGGTPGSRSMDRREALIGREADLLARRADAEMAGAQMAEDAYAESMRRQALLEQERRSAYDDAQGRYQRSIDSLASMREDPARLLRSAAGGVSAAIAIGLGAAGAALAGGGENTALAIVQRNIDRDIAAQRTDIQTAGTVAANQQSVLAAMQREFSDRQAAENATRSVMLGAAAAQAQRVTAGLGNEAAQLRGEQMVQQFRDESAAAAAQAQAQEAEAQLQRRLLEARAQRVELANVGTARRLQGGPGRARPTTAPQARVYNATFDSLDTRLPLGERVRIASEASGIPMGVAGALAGGRFAEGAAEETSRNVTTATMGAYNQLRESGATHAAALSAAGLPSNLPEPTGERFTEPQSDSTAGTIAALQASINRIRTITNPRSGTQTLPVPEDVPGVGTIESRLPYSMLSQAGRDIQNELLNARDLVGRLRSQGAIAADEDVRFGRILEGGGTEDDLRSGLDRIQAEINARGTRSRQSAEERAVGSQPAGMMGVR